MVALTTCSAAVLPPSQYNKISKTTEKFNQAGPQRPAFLLPIPVRQPFGRLT
jgi:hypothetical protein